ncbi:holo-ACP synthase [bacterium]|nr:holo-ACP synthase [bacterium]
MILGLGIDTIEIERFETIHLESSARLRNRLFTVQEQAYCLAKVNPAPHFAARFAAKEAFAKALGRGIAHGIQWVDVEVLRDEAGAPSLALHRRAAELAAEREVGSTHLSLSHSRLVAVATVILDSEAREL